MRSQVLICAAMVGGVGWMTLGCSSTPTNTGYTGSSGGSNGASGGSTSSGGSSASGGSVGSGGGLSTGGGTASGGAGTQTGGGTATGGGLPTGGSTTGGTTGSGGAAGGPAGGTSGQMSAGCGMTTTQAAGQYVKFALSVPGQPAASMSRLYYVRLPTNYTPGRAYPTIYLGPGCGVAQDSMPTTRKGLPFESDPNAAAAATDAILIQMEPGFYNPAQYNGPTCVAGAPPTATNACAYCFDDWAYLSTIPESSTMVAIERAYFDSLHKAVEAKYCVDKSRQFFAGYSSGGWLAQQLGCWFPDVLRAQANVTGGLPPPILTNVKGANDYCAKHPIAAIAIHDFVDTSNVYQGTVDGMSRIFKLNGCTGTFAPPPDPLGGAPMPAGLVPYTITGVPNSNVFKCYQYSTCPAANPMVFCVSHDSLHGDQHARAVPGFWQFFSKF